MEDRLGCWIRDFQLLFFDSVDRFDYLFGYLYLLRNKEDYLHASNLFRRGAARCEEMRDCLESMVDTDLFKGWHPVQQAQLKGLCSELQSICAAACEVCEKVWRARALDEQYSKIESDDLLNELSERVTELQVAHNHLIEELNGTGLIYSVKIFQWTFLKVWIFAGLVISLAGCIIALIILGPTTWLWLVPFVCLALTGLLGGLVMLVKSRRVIQGIRRR